MQTPLCWLCLQERFVVHVTDVLAVSMMLGITAQVKEAGIAWDKGEKKSKDLEQARFCSGAQGQRPQGPGRGRGQGGPTAQPPGSKGVARSCPFSCLFPSVIRR